MRFRSVVEPVYTSGPMEAPRAGDYLTRLHHGTIPATAAAPNKAAGLSAIPLYLPKGCTIDQAGFMHNAAAAGTAHAGIYTDDGARYPAALRIDSGAIVADGVNHFQATTFATPVYLQAAPYWIVILTTGVYAGAWDLSSSTWDGNFIALRQFPPTPGGRKPFWYDLAGAYAALPATFPAGAGAFGVTNAALPYFHVLSVDR